MGTWAVIDLQLALGFDPQDPAAAAVEVADDVTHVVFRHGHHHLHDGLQQGGFGQFAAFL